MTARWPDGSGGFRNSTWATHKEEKGEQTMDSKERIDHLNERIGHLWPIRNKLQREIEAIDKEIMPLYKEKWKLETILVGVKKCPAFTPHHAEKRQFKEEDLATIVANFKNYSPTKQADIIEKLSKRISDSGKEG